MKAMQSVSGEKELKPKISSCYAASGLLAKIFDKVVGFLLIG